MEAESVRAVAAPHGMHQSVSNKEHRKSSTGKVASPEKAAQEGVLQLCGKDRRGEADSYEKARIVKIEAYFDGALREGTGFVVSDSTIVTAAHNIFSFERGTFADKVTVGFNGQTRKSKELFTVRGFISGEHDECDYGAISLETPFGGASVMDYGDDHELGKVRVAGYPKPDLEGKATLNAGRRMGKKLVADGGDVKERNGLLMWVNDVQTSTGQSGSPVLRPKRIAIAIHTGGRCDVNKPLEKSVRIEGPVRENIDIWKRRKN